MSDGRKPTNKSTEKTTKEKQTQIRNSCFERKSLLISQTLQYKTLLPPMRKKTNFTNFVKNFSKQLKAVWTQVTDKKNYIDPPTPPPPPPHPTLHLLRGLTSLPAGPDGAAARRSSLWSSPCCTAGTSVCPRDTWGSRENYTQIWFFCFSRLLCLFCSLLEVKRSIPAVLRTGCLYTRASTSYSELSKLIKIPHWIDDASGRAVPSALTGYLQSCGCESWLVLHLLDHFILKK